MVVVSLSTQTHIGLFPWKHKKRAPTRESCRTSGVETCLVLGIWDRLCGFCPQEGYLCPAEGLDSVVNTRALQLHIGSIQGNGLHARSVNVGGTLYGLLCCKIPAQTPAINCSLHGRQYGCDED